MISPFLSRHLSSLPIHQEERFLGFQSYSPPPQPLLYCLFSNTVNTAVVSLLIISSSLSPELWSCMATFLLGIVCSQLPSSNSLKLLSVVPSCSHSWSFRSSWICDGSPQLPTGHRLLHPSGSISSNQPCRLYSGPHHLSLIQARQWLFFSSSFSSPLPCVLGAA